VFLVGLDVTAGLSLILSCCPDYPETYLSLATLFNTPFSSSPLVFLKGFYFVFPINQDFLNFLAAIPIDPFRRVVFHASIGCFFFVAHLRPLPGRSSLLIISLRPPPTFLAFPGKRSTDLKFNALPVLFSHIWHRQFQAL